MMRFISIVSIALLTGCAQQEDQLIVESNGDKIVSITKDRSNRTQKDTFLYVDGSLSIIREATEDIVFHYNEGRLIFSSHISRDDSLIFAVDSITYDSKERMVQLIHYSLNSNGQLEMNGKDLFDYNMEDQIITRTSIRADLSIGVRVTYEWSNNNVVAEKRFDGQGALLSETEYEYDDYNNYLMQDYRLIRDMASWNANNIKRTRIRDYTGRISYYCTDCSSRYKYNLDGYPVTHEYEWGLTATVEYQ